jgi:hypothetical protein
MKRYKSYCFLRLFYVVLFAYPVNTFAVTWPEVGPDQASVAATIANAVDGDTVQVREGTATWTQTLVVSKAITLKGAGIGKTVILDGMTNGAALIVINGVANKITRLTGFEFRDGGRTGQGSVIYLRADGYDSRRMRIDNNKFDHLKAFAIRPEGVVGVIDHNQFYATPTNIFIYVFHQFIGLDPVHSDSSWSNPINWGSENFLFVEDNHFEYDTTYYAVNDGYGGGRVVFRYNTIVNGWFEQHGTESGGRARGTRGGEIYGNHFDCRNAVTNTIANLRSGTWLIHNNTSVNCDANGGPGFTITAYRNIGPAAFNGADGTNPWDKNVPGGPFLSGIVSEAGIATTPYVKVAGANWVIDQWAGYSIRKTSGRTNCTSLSHSGGQQPVATITCPNHGFRAGDVFTLRGVDQIDYLDAHRIGSVVDSNTFTFTLGWGANPHTPATGNFSVSSGQDFAYIRKNTSDTFTLDFPANFAPVAFAAGDSFVLWKVDQSIDQACVAQGANLGGVWYPAIPAGWPNQVSEGCYEWNNTRQNGGNINFNAQYPAQIRHGEHYFNDHCPPGGYVPYTYPHPLTGNPLQIQNINCPTSVIPRAPTQLRLAE